jgi:hypothetical protein
MVPLFLFAERGRSDLLGSDRHARAVRHHNTAGASRP